MEDFFGYYAVFSLLVYIFGVGFLFTFLPAVIYINNQRTLRFIANIEQDSSNKKLRLIYFWWLFIRCIFLYISLCFVFYIFNNMVNIFLLFYILLPITAVTWCINYLGQRKINIILRKKLNEQGVLRYEYTPPQNDKKLNEIFKPSYNKLFKITVYLILFFTAPMILFFSFWLFAMGIFGMVDLLKDFFGMKKDLMEYISFFTVLISFLTGFIAPLIQYKENLTFQKTVDRILNKKS